jgi:hypothetical protein
VLIVQAYEISQYVVPRGGISLGKWRSSFAGNSDGKMDVQSACAVNTRHVYVHRTPPRTEHTPHTQHNRVTP